MATARDKLREVKQILDSGVKDAEKVRAIHTATASASPPPPPSLPLLRSDDFTGGLAGLIDKWGENTHVSDPAYPRAWPRTQFLTENGETFIRLTAFEGDHLLWGNNQRNEIGLNNRPLNWTGSDYTAPMTKPTDSYDTFFLYENGMDTITEFWTRLPVWPADKVTTWDQQGGWMQNKQTQSYEPSGGDHLGVNFGIAYRKGAAPYGEMIFDVQWRDDGKVYVPCPPRAEWFHISTRSRWAYPQNGFHSVKVNGVHYGTVSNWRTLSADAPERDRAPIAAHFRLGPYVHETWPTCAADFKRVRIYNASALPTTEHPTPGWPG